VSRRAPALSALRRRAQVLHMDRNNYYGGESASYNLTQARSAAQRASAQPHATRLAAR
jgi:RAB protein geranylgeranyltransferase component A